MTSILYMYAILVNLRLGALVGRPACMNLLQAHNESASFAKVYGGFLCQAGRALVQSS